MSTEFKHHQEAMEIIKEAILQSKYLSAKSVTGKQLSFYFYNGSYISNNSRKGSWEPYLNCSTTHYFSVNKIADKIDIDGKFLSNMKDMRSLLTN